MKKGRLSVAAGVAALAILAMGANYASAHCDGLDGPVVKAAQRALDTRNPNLVLIWVGKESEPELTTAFQQALKVRALGPDGKALADRHFFETVVRLHRTGEGAPYTGLKPAGRDMGPAIRAADQAMESGDPAALEALLVKELRAGLRDAFNDVQATRRYDANDIAAGREHVKAYVEYIHFVERLHEAITHRAAGHYPETETHE